VVDRRTQATRSKLGLRRTVLCRRLVRTCSGNDGQLLSGDLVRLLVMLME
jgi:hypothetical protein